MLYSSLGLGCFGLFGFCLGLVLFTFPIGHFLIIDEFLVVIPDGLDRFAEPLEVDARFVNL